MLSNWFLCRSRTFVSPFHRGGTLNGSSRHWIGNVSSSEHGFFLTPNCSLQLSGRGQGPNCCNYGSPVLLRARSENGQTYWSKAPIDCGADCVRFAPGSDQLAPSDILRRHTRSRGQSN